MRARMVDGPEAMPIMRDEPLVNLNARVPKHLWRRVRLQCLREERLLRSFITDALREYLRRRAGRRA
jgi:hypothetical protein